MVLDITFSNTFFHSFLSEKGIFLGHPCVEGGGLCCTEEVFLGFLPSHLPRVFVHVTSELPGYRWGGPKGSEGRCTPFSRLQLWKSACEGTFIPLLAVLHRIGFSLTPLSHTPCPRGEAGNTWLRTSRVWCLYRAERLSDLYFPLTSLLQTSRFQINFLRAEVERETHQKQWEDLLVSVSPGFLRNIKTEKLSKKGSCVNRKNMGVSVKL